MKSLPIRPRSAFDEDGFSATIESMKKTVQQLYLANEIPWVVGYSGGKDSTATLQLVWMAVSELKKEQLHKPIHVISTDTLVENPVVSSWVNNSLLEMTRAAEEQHLPIQAHKLTPALKDSFWVNLIGRGYPAPRPKFRWCTERLKINPSNKFIREVVQSSGEAIMVLGTRKAESAGRRSRMENLENQRIDDYLSPSQSLPNSWVFSPLENWSNDDVWLFLMQVKNPWHNDNKQLLTMYQGASEDAECPLVVDTSTPSCGSSRFGCWTCTLVEKDKSMSAMIQNDQEKEWMLPLLDLRNELDIADDRHLRDFRRMNGSVQLYKDRPIHGPYTQDARHNWLRRLLEAQTWIRENGPEYVSNLELISDDELREIRRIWVVEKHEFEDELPSIYLNATGRKLEQESTLETSSLKKELVSTLRDITGDDQIHFELVRELLAVEQRHHLKVRRAGLFEDLEKSIRRGFYQSAEDAEEFALFKQEVRKPKEGPEVSVEDVASGYIRKRSSPE